MAVALGEQDLPDAAEEPGADEERRLRPVGSVQPNGMVANESSTEVSEK